MARKGLRLLIAGLMACSSMTCGGETEETEETHEEDCREQRNTDVERFDADGELCESFDRRGPHEVGVTDFEIDDGIAVAAFYPAVEEACEAERFRYDMRDFLPEEDRDLISDEEAPFFEVDAAVDAAPTVDDGPFPVVLFSHGLAGYRYQSSTLLAHLASWGHVVLSAEHEGRNMAHVLGSSSGIEDDAPESLRAMVTYLGDAVEDEESRFYDLVDLSAIGVTGHSMGGNGVQSMVGESGVDAVIFYASNAEVEDEGQVAAMWQAGSTDLLAQPDVVEDSYDDAPAPKRFLAIEGAGHLAFSDICAIGEDRGGVLEIASEAGMDIPDFIINLGEDGCRDTDLDYESAWPIIHHYSVAHLRAELAPEEAEVGLSEEETSCFSSLTELTLRRE